MDRNKDYRIALIIKTDGLEFDDRVRKEIVTVNKLYPNITFKIFVMLPENKETTGVTSYGTPYRSVYIKSRDKYPSAKRVVLKSYEFYQSIKEEIKTFDAIWCANDDTALIAALVKKDHLLWDLHEIPTAMLNNPVKRLLLKRIFSRSKVVIHANPQRANYLHEIGVISDLSKHYAIRNYPNFDDEEKETDEVYESFMTWKYNRKCVYLQGLLNDSRAAYESIKAVLAFPDLCCVVVGKYDEKSTERLKTEFGESFTERVRFIGKIAQLRIPHYVKQCYLSLVFYKNVRPNNFYCEANRFYQSVVLGLPVVVGNNPSMKELVDKYGFGVSIDDDGGDVDIIINGIKNVIDNYQLYQNNNLKYRNELLWDNQMNVFKEIIEHLFN